MRSLFIKIFLWFWAASILIIVSTLVLLALLDPYEPVREDGRQIRKMAHFGRTAVAILERNGPEALQDFMHRKKRGHGRHLFLFDKNINALTGRSSPSHVKKLAERAGKSGVTEFYRTDRNILLAQNIYGPDGSYYIMVSELPRRPRSSPLSRFLNPRLISLRLLAIFIVASVFCYWLAWHLTSPIRKLRIAAQLISSGNLQTRVSPEIGNRNDELAELGQDFDMMAERIESLLTSQSRLLRDISHELRSPLARLNVALELARQRSGKESGEALDHIERESERLNELIGQLRTLTLLESGSEKIEKTNIDLSHLIKRVADDTDFEARNRSRSVKAEISDNIMINGSRELLRRAIENVVRNAVRHTAENTEVQVYVRRKKINDKNSVVLTVRDHGPGVPEEVLTSLFSPFYRVAESRDRQSGGMGIGLAITDRAVRVHGGEVKAFNASDGGLVIEIILPLSTVQSACSAVRP